MNLANQTRAYVIVTGNLQHLPAVPIATFVATLPSHTVPYLGWYRLFDAIHPNHPPTHVKEH